MSRILAIVFTTSLLLLSSCQKSGESHLAAGKAYLASNKLDDAAISLRNAIPKLANPAEAHFQLATVELRRNNFGASFVQALRAIELQPANVDARVLAADLSLLQLDRDPRRPVKLYNELVREVTYLEKERPGQYDTNRLRGLLDLLDQKSESGIKFLQLARKTNANDRKLILPLVRALLSGTTEQEQEGESLAKSGLIADPTFSPLYELLYRFYILKNRPSEAEQLLAQLVQANPRSDQPRIQLAAHHAAADNTAAAQQALEPLLKNATQFPGVHLRIANMYLRLGKRVEARTYLESGAASDKSQGQAYQKLIANVDWADGRREEAIKRIVQAAQADPNDEEARRIRASFLLARGKQEDMETVIRDYSLLLAKYKGDRILHYQLGRAYRLRGDRENAWRNFRAAAQSGSPYLAPQLSMAEMSAESMRYDDTLRYLEEILRYDNTNDTIQLMHIATLRNLGRSREAAAELDYLSRKDPANPELLIERGLQAISLGQFEQAEGIFSRLYKVGQRDVRPAMGLVEAYLGRRNYAAAVRVMEEELRQTPSSIELRFALGNITARAGQPAVAIGHFQKLVEMQPRNAEALVRLGQIEGDTGARDASLNHLRRAVGLSPGNPGVLLALATQLHTFGMTDQALEYYREARKLDPKNSVISNNMAFLLSQKQETLSEAFQLAQQAVDGAPSNLSYQDTQAYVLIQQKRFKEADIILRRLLQALPNNSTVHLRTGLLNLRQGDRAKARTELERALQLHPAPSEMEEIKSLLKEAQ